MAQLGKIGFGLIKPSVQRQRLRRGVTLLEGLASLSILLVGLGGMAIAYQRHIYQTVASRNMTQASMIAQSVLAELQATEPSAWNLSVFENKYAFNFQGERVPKSDPLAYYKPKVTQIVQPGWHDVTIAITWQNWKREQRRTGFKNTSDDFAYVLEMSISPQYGITRTTAAGGP